MTEFNAVLRQYNVMADRGKEGMVMFKKNGLLYSMLDAKGNKIGVPIKASALNSKPTLRNLEGQFQQRSTLKQVGKERLINIVDSFFRGHDRDARTSFCAYMTSHGINAMFRQDKEGRVYGLTFIENKSGAVFNGSDLGKAYSGQALTKRFDHRIAGEKESPEPIDRALELSNGGDHNRSDRFLLKGIINDLSDLMKAEKSSGDPIDKNLLKKRRKRISR